jgi:lipopolysaccharide/colanic/teichoic acid biosynthesis glycosyltransferase
MAPRVGRNNIIFKMVKLRSMVSNADSSGVDSTSANDSRITPIGHKIRKYKLDEITQLWNVLIGDMSLVGPRPNVKNETDLYTYNPFKGLRFRDNGNDRINNQLQI